MNYLKYAMIYVLLLSACSKKQEAIVAPLLNDMVGVTDSFKGEYYFFYSYAYENPGTGGDTAFTMPMTVYLYRNGTADSVCFYDSLTRHTIVIDPSFYSGQCDYFGINRLTFPVSADSMYSADGFTLLHTGDSLKYDYSEYYHNKGNDITHTRICRFRGRKE